MMRPGDDRMTCTGCGATADQDKDRAEQFVSTTEQTTDDVIETSAAANFEGKPTADDVTCEDCGHGTAWYTIKQTGAADEPPTRFFKCKDCGNRWREYN